jgi:toxin FitB
LSEVGYLLDTNVVSERRRNKPDARVAAFVDSLTNDLVFLSVLTIGELRKGAVARRQVDRAHARRLDAWITGLEESFADRILPVDLDTAKLWGRLAAERPRATIDTLIAATAMTHNLRLVTRNVTHVRDTGVELINPWS